MKKRIVGLLLSIIMALVVLPMDVHADEFQEGLSLRVVAPKEGENPSYTVDNYYSNWCTATIVSWENYETHEELNDSSVFERGENYTCTINVVAKDGTWFPDRFNVGINGSAHGAIALERDVAGHVTKIEVSEIFYCYADVENPIISEFTVLGLKTMEGDTNHFENVSFSNNAISINKEATIDLLVETLIGLGLRLDQYEAMTEEEYRNWENGLTEDERNLFAAVALVLAFRGNRIQIYNSETGEYNNITKDTPLIGGEKYKYELVPLIEKGYKMAGEYTVFADMPEGVREVSHAASTVTIVFTAQERVEDYHISVNGTQVTDRNCDNVLGDDPASVIYDNSTHTLTVKKAVSSIAADFTDKLTLNIEESQTEPITVSTKGDLDIVGNDDFGIFQETSSITADGNVSVSAVAGTFVSSQKPITIIAGGKVDVSTSYDPGNNAALFKTTIKAGNDITLINTGKAAVVSLLDATTDGNLTVKNTASATKELICSDTTLNVKGNVLLENNGSGQVIGGKLDIQKANNVNVTNNNSENVALMISEADIKATGKVTFENKGCGSVIGGAGSMGRRLGNLSVNAKSLEITGNLNPAMATSSFGNLLNGIVSVNVTDGFKFINKGVGNIMNSTLTFDDSLYDVYGFNSLTPVREKTEIASGTALSSILGYGSFKLICNIKDGDIPTSDPAPESHHSDPAPAETPASTPAAPAAPAATPSRISVSEVPGRDVEPVTTTAPTAIVEESKSSAGEKEAVTEVKEKEEKPEEAVSETIKSKETESETTTIGSEKTKTPEANIADGVGNNYLFIWLTILAILLILAAVTYAYLKKRKSANEQ